MNKTRIYYTSRTDLHSTHQSHHADIPAYVLTHVTFSTIWAPVGPTIANAAKLPPEVFNIADLLGDRLSDCWL